MAQLHIFMKFALRASFRLFLNSFCRRSFFKQMLPLWFNEDGNTVCNLT